MCVKDLASHAFVVGQFLFAVEPFIIVHTSISQCTPTPIRTHSSAVNDYFIAPVIHAYTYIRKPH